MDKTAAIKYNDVDTKVSQGRIYVAITIVSTSLYFMAAVLYILQS
jgi:hypothetical protein